MSEDRFERGWRRITEIDQPGAEAFRDGVEGFAPDLYRDTVEFVYGDVLTRPGLDLKTREIATVAALTALGNARSQLRFHIHGALNVGCTRHEVLEVISQMAVYAGYPAALNGISVARQVFEEQDSGKQS
ncbi:MAG: carboxymuconolactone decarboxylase family protein [Actinomycetota bacterium]|nr:carboxymuconolactone decarboxylase family protein [Actinomycetota bacterium]